MRGLSRMFARDEPHKHRQWLSPSPVVLEGRQVSTRGSNLAKGVRDEMVYLALQGPMPDLSTVVGDVASGHGAKLYRCEVVEGIVVGLAGMARGDRG
jgi:hypothetical protein